MELVRYFQFLQISFKASKYIIYVYFPVFNFSLASKETFKNLQNQIKIKFFEKNENT